MSEMYHSILDKVNKCRTTYLGYIIAIFRSAPFLSLGNPQLSDYIALKVNRKAVAARNEGSI